MLHLSRNANSQFGLLDLNVNKFLGVFGKQHIEFSNEELAGRKHFLVNRLVEQRLGAVTVECWTCDF